MSVWLIGSKLCLGKTVSERKCVSQTCVQEEYHAIKTDGNLS